MFGGTKPWQIQKLNDLNGMLEKDKRLRKPLMKGVSPYSWKPVFTHFCILMVSLPSYTKPEKVMGGFEIFQNGWTYHGWMRMIAIECIGVNSGI